MVDRLRVLLLLTLLLCLAGTARSQVARSVGPGGFRDLATAYSASAPGDVIHVYVDTDLPLLSGKGVQIYGHGPSRPCLRVAPSVFAPAKNIADVPAGEVLVLEGFTI